MKILIATPLFPPDVGGPAHYAKELGAAFCALGHETRVVSFSSFLKFPTVVRHLLYFFRIFFFLKGMDAVVVLDTWSVALPAVCAAKLLRKKTLIRVGGDFLWESHVNRTKSAILLSEFYETSRQFSVKEKIIFRLTRFLLQSSNAVAFTTEWQRTIFIGAYGLSSEKTFVVENYYGTRREGENPKEKNFLWAGRSIFLKNVDLLRRAFEKAKGRAEGDISLHIVTGMEKEGLQKKIQSCYAVIVPSLSEVSPNLVLEAVIFGKPFIATRDTGLFEKLENAGGFFVDPRDEETMAEKIALLSREETYREMKEKARRFTFTHSYRDIALEYIALLS